MAYTAFWTKAPLRGKKIFQKEQPVMIKKPSLSIHIELYIIYPFPNNKYWRTFFHLRKVILPDFSLLWFKRKRIWIWKRKNVLGRRKKSLLIRPCRYPAPFQSDVLKYAVFFRRLPLYIHLFKIWSDFKKLFSICLDLKNGDWFPTFSKILLQFCALNTSMPWIIFSPENISFYVWMKRIWGI